MAAGASKDPRYAGGAAGARAGPGGGAGGRDDPGARVRMPGAAGLHPGPPLPLPVTGNGPLRPRPRPFDGPPRLRSSLLDSQRVVRRKGAEDRPVKVIPLAAESL